MCLRVSIKAEFWKVVWDPVITSFFVLTDRQVLLHPQSSNSRLIALSPFRNHFSVWAIVSKQWHSISNITERVWETETQMEIKCPPTFIFTLKKIRRILNVLKLNINSLAESCCCNELYIEASSLVLRRGSGFKASWHAWQVHNASSQCSYATGEGNFCHLPRKNLSAEQNSEILLVPPGYLKIHDRNICPWWFYTDDVGGGGILQFHIYIYLVVC